jgi:A/G-specific adenine glycosylase
MRNQEVSGQLISWFHKNKRSLPFRETSDPYKIWLSEIMAQQTQIKTVVEYYNRFIKIFPEVTDLAKASEEEVLKQWEGLGYYSRAKNLHKCAKVIAEEYNGIFPGEYEKLKALPGIGPYTAGAVGSIAFNLPVPAVDGNVLRVITRLYGLYDDIGLGKTKKKIEGIIKDIIPSNQCGSFNEALMELGAQVCIPRNPACKICPVRNWCKAFLENTIDYIPYKSKKAKAKKEKIIVLVVEKNGHWLLEKRPEKGLLASMWGFPIVQAKENQLQTIQDYLSSYDLSGNFIIEKAGNKKHVFTHVIWEMTVYRVIYPDALCEETVAYGDETLKFIEKNNIGQLALPKAFSKIIDLL